MAGVFDGCSGKELGIEGVIVRENRGKGRREVGLFFEVVLDRERRSRRRWWRCGFSNRRWSCRFNNRRRRGFSNRRRGGFNNRRRRRRRFFG
jgi:hypothetical protein